MSYLLNNCFRVQEAPIYRNFPCVLFSPVTVLLYIPLSFGVLIFQHLSLCSISFPLFHTLSQCFVIFFYFPPFPSTFLDLTYSYTSSPVSSSPSFSLFLRFPLFPEFILFSSVTLFFYFSRCFASLSPSASLDSCP